MSDRSVTGIIDYGIGNVRSVKNAVEQVGGSAVLSSDHSQLLECDRLILPGVGAFPHGIAELRSRGLDKLLDRAVKDGRHLLGICLGMQLLTEGSFEFGKTAGLGFLSGWVKKIESPLGSAPMRLPHVSWKPIQKTQNSLDWFFRGASPEAKYYFIHSFAVSNDYSDVIAEATYEELRFASVLGRGNVLGTQFHPEKSGREGLTLLKNFVSMGTI